MPANFDWLSAYLPILPDGSILSDSVDSITLNDKQQLKTPTNHNENSIPIHIKTDDSSGGSVSSPDVAIHRTSIATGGAAPIAARESVVRYQMALRETAFTDLKQMNVFLGTYNVNGQPPTSGLADWLSIDTDPPPDIYAVGFQELDLSKEAFVFNETPREDEWLRAVQRALHPKAKYRKVRLVRLVGMMLVVFVQEKHFAYIRGIASECVGTGLMGKMGNKVR